LSAAEATPVTVAQVDFERAQRAGCCVYSLEYDLIHDIERQAQDAFQLFNNWEAGARYDVVLDFASLGDWMTPLESACR